MFYIEIVYDIIHFLCISLLVFTNICGFVLPLRDISFNIFTFFHTYVGGRSNGTDE